jgi:superfamily II DNA or RNA helicase
LILAHRQELVLQAYSHSKREHPHKSVEIELAKEHATGTADVTIASVQSIKSRLEKYDPSQFKLIIVDECHHIVTPTYMKILEHFNLKELCEDSPFLAGFSATMSRADGLKLGRVLDHIVYHKLGVQTDCVK